MAVSPVDLAPEPSDGDLRQNLLDEGLRPPKRRPPWYLEALIVIWLSWAYDLIANLAPIRQAAAVAHGRAIIGLEQGFHLDPERALDHWLSGHPTLGLWVSNYYDNAHFVVTFAIVGWLFWCHPGYYRRLRTSLVLINVIGFVVFWLYPTAPPRMLPGYGIADVVAATGAFGAWHGGDLARHANELAAMPSLHLAWALWSALAVWRVLRRYRWAPLVFAYPLATALTVLATGNHYLLDLVAGIATVGAAEFGAKRLGLLGARLPLPARLRRRRLRLRLAESAMGQS